MEADESELITLADLIVGKGVTVGVLATAIETHGIQGFDRFGRFRSWPPDSDGAKRALELLAIQWAHPDGYDEMSPADHDQGDTEYSNFGWPRGELPDFKALSRDVIVAPARPQSVKKRENAELAIIGMLLRFIRGELSRNKHPDFSSEAELINVLDDQRDSGRYPGLSRSNLAGKFAAAKKVLQDREG